MNFFYNNYFLLFMAVLIYYPLKRLLLQLTSLEKNLWGGIIQFKVPSAPDAASGAQTLN